jgi:hypothetical protein
MDENRFIESTLGNRRRLGEIIAAAVVLAVGVNLLSSRLFAEWPRAGTWIGVLCISAPVIALVIRLFGRLTRVELIEGYFLYRQSDNTIVAVPEYEFASTIERYLSALFSENPALFQLWQDQSLTKSPNIDDPKRDEWASVELIAQAGEYWVMDKLSTRLSGHFRSKSSEDGVLEISRGDIPDVLLQNRFLKLFSEPMEERIPFARKDDGDDDNKQHLIQIIRKEGPEDPGVVVAAYGAGGAIFDRFQLVLPEGSNVRRLGKSSVMVETTRFKFEFEVIFPGYLTNIDPIFARRYLREDWGDLTPYKVDLRIQTKMKWRGLLSSRGWDYYQWLDEFVEVLRREMSADEFVDRIGWATAKTLIRASSPVAGATTAKGSLPAPEDARTRVGNEPSAEVET